MPKRIEWTAAEDATIIRMRAAGATWDSLVASIGHHRWALIERGRRIGASIPGRSPADGDAEEREDQRRGAMRAGHPISWGAITKGTVLDGAKFDYRDPLTH